MWIWRYLNTRKDVIHKFNYFVTYKFHFERVKRENNLPKRLLCQPLTHAKWQCEDVELCKVNIKRYYVNVHVFARFYVSIVHNIKEKFQLITLIWCSSNPWTRKHQQNVCLIGSVVINTWAVLPLSVHCLNNRSPFLRWIQLLYF